MDSLAQPLTGTCAFRLMPIDPLVEGASDAVLSRLGAGLALAYTWTHPTDGVQRGGLVVGAADDDGRLEASWFDTWHQQPGLMSLPGTRIGDRVELAGSYAGDWGWTITLDVGDPEPSMTMRNVVPESALADLPPGSPPMDAGAYDVMVARWRTP